MNFIIQKKEEMGIKWFHYLTAAVITLLGLFFIIYGKIHIIEIDKSTQQIRKNQRSIFCRDKLMLYDLNTIKGVKGFQRGHKGLSIDNRHFDIMIYFKQDTLNDEEENVTYKIEPVRILDTNNVVKASQ